MDLQTKFNKCVVVCGLRDILTQHGIPQTEAVTVKIEQPRGKDIVTTTVPTNKGTVFANTSSDFRGDVIEFLNRADAMFELVSELPKSSVSTTSQTGGVEQTIYEYKMTFECGKLESAIPDSVEFPPEMKKSSLAVISVPFAKIIPWPPRPCCTF